jgi:Putative transposase
VDVLSALFRPLFLHKLGAAYQADELQFFGKHARLIDPQAFAAYLKPLRNTKWVVYCKRPFGGPKEVLRYLARYTHRVAISNRRLLSLDDKGVTFKWKDYRLEGRERYQVMTLATHEFIRRFLMHVLPGRRLPERVARSSSPASENLHNKRHMRRSKTILRSPRRRGRAAFRAHRGRAWFGRPTDPRVTAVMRY